MPKEAVDLLSSPIEPASLPRVVILAGGDTALRRWVLSALTAGGDAERMDGEELLWRDCLDEVSTRSLFDLGGPRLVIVPKADELVKNYRKEIEEYLTKPSPAGRLFLAVQSLPANTRIFKMVEKDYLLVRCEVPQGKRLRDFLCQYVAPRHQVRLTDSAADSLVELVGTDIGMLDTEIAKLCLYEKPGGKIDVDLVRDVVGGWRAKSIWQTIDAIAAGNAGEAIRQLDRMMGSGQKPIALFPQIAWGLRRYGLAVAALEHAEQHQGRGSLAAALRSIGVQDFEIKKMESQIRQLGRQRCRNLLQWLLEADLKLKGSHSDDGPDRWVMEELVLKLASLGPAEVAQ